MHNHTVIANSKGKEVGREDIQLADTIAEAVELSGGEDKVIALVNRCRVTDKSNTLRRPSSAGIEVKTRVELYHSMVEAGVPEAQARTLAKVNDEDIERVAAVAAA